MNYVPNPELMRPDYETRKELTMADVNVETLRSWADAGVITVARYLEEVSRRAGE